MKRFSKLALGAVWCVAGLTLPLAAEPLTLLANPEAAQRNVAASPKLDPRVFVYGAEGVTGSVLVHPAGSREVLLDVGAREGVRFGHVFQISAKSRGENAGIAKVIELQPHRCVAQLVSVDPHAAETSLLGLTAVCAAPQPAKNRTVIRCAFGKDVWQTESFENRLIRGLLGSADGDTQILIREDSSYQAADR